MPGKFHKWRSLGGYSPWGPKELGTTERLHFVIYKEGSDSETTLREQRDSVNKYFKVERAKFNVVRINKCY